MPDHETFLDALSAQVQGRPNHPALVFTADPTRPASDVRLSYAQLDTRARLLAQRLSRRVAAGERALLLYPPGPDFLIGFLGCLYAGVIAVPSPPPDGFRRQRERLTGIGRDAAVTAVLTSSPAAAAVREWMTESELTGCAALLVSDVEVGEPDETGPAGWTPAVIDSHTLAFLQYTSGSTHHPKGVQIDHANLLSNCRFFIAIMGITRADTVGGWLPHYHDFGLIGQLLTPLVLGVTSVSMPAVAFVKRPVAWLRLISDYGVTFSPAPNFALDLCTRRISDEQLAGLDLSGWRLIVNGSEPIRVSTLRDFTERFAPAGLRPETVGSGYGLAEATLCVTGAPSGPAATASFLSEELERGRAVRAGAEDITAGRSRDLASSGSTRESVQILIVDPRSRSVLPEGRIGEIWVGGPSVSRGYWRNPEATALAFGFSTADGEGEYLRTGDLGLLEGDELFVTGRIKELLIMGGRNLYPQDLEADVRSVHDSLARGVGAAFTVETGSSEGPQANLVVVHECRSAPELLDTTGAAVKEMLGRDHGLAASVVLVRPNTVPRTTSGKIQRALARDLFITGELSVQYETLTPSVRRRYRAPAADLARPSTTGDLDPVA